MSGYYIIQLNREKLPPIYVSVDSLDPFCRVISSRGSATRFETHGVASVVSDYFWANYWDKFKRTHKILTRETIYVKARRP